MRKNIRLLSSIVLISLFAIIKVFAFSEKDIISPVDGTWSNVQPLVLNVQDGNYLYYSFNSTDPLVSGFAYDGPVVIDQTGNIVLYITAVNNEGKRSDFTIKYSVIKTEQNNISAEAILFLQNITNDPIRKYTSGTQFSIPSDFKYCMGEEKTPSLKGTQLSISSNNKLERYLPCVISNGEYFWRFIIHTVAAEVDSVTSRTVPFSIENWTTFKYTGEKLIYQIDDDYWSASTEPINLDRSVPHVIRWQSISYELGNEIQSYTIPPKPELNVKKMEDGTVSFTVSSDYDFELGASNIRPDSGIITSGLYNSIQVDTFPGDMIGGKMILSVFFDNVYQGTLEENYSIDKQPPEPPSITSSSEGKYVRDNLTISITSEDDSVIFYSISKPLISETGFEGSSTSVFDSITTGEFQYYSNPIKLKSLDNAAFYKINSFAVDEAGNKSSISEYRVVVDEYNYYLSPDGSSFENQKDYSSAALKSEPDGSYGNPFTSFKQALKVINSNSYTRLHILKDVTFESGVIEIKSDCILLGDNVKVIIPQDSVIKVSDAKFEVQNINFEKQVSIAYDKTFLSDEELECVQKMFLLRNGKAIFSNCELIGVFGSDGILFDSDSSDIDFKNCGVTVQADKYACAISSVDSNVIVLKQRVTSIAQTSVCYSVLRGTVNVQSSSCSVIGHLCRIAELKNTNASFENNSFIAKLDEPNKNIAAIWKDVDTVLNQNENETNGFIK